MEEHIYFPQRFGINPDLNSNTAGSLSNVAFQFTRLETRFLESCGFLQLWALKGPHPVCEYTRRTTAGGYGLNHAESGMPRVSTP